MATEPLTPALDAPAAPLPESAPTATPEAEAPRFGFLAPEGDPIMLAAGGGAWANALKTAAKKNATITLEEVLDEGGDAAAGALPKYAGNINLERLDGPQAVNQVIKSMADILDPAVVEKATRGRVSHVATEEAARAQFGEAEGVLLNRATGQAFNAEEITASRMLLVQSRDRVRELAEAVRAGQNEDGALVEFRHALNRHAAIQLQLNGAAAEAGRALSAFRIVASDPGIKLDETEALIQHSGGRKGTLDMVEKYLALETDAQRNAFTRSMAAPGAMDMVRELWYSSILSGPQTHAVNVASNALFMGGVLPVERQVAGVINKLFNHGDGLFAGSKDGVQMREAGAMYAAYIRSMKDAFKLAAYAYRHETDAGQALGYQAPFTLVDAMKRHTPGVNAPGQAAAGKLSDYRPKAISGEALRAVGQRGIAAANRYAGRELINPERLQSGGVLGRMVDFLGGTVRAPAGRALMAEDAFFKTVAYRGELHALANRDGLAKGLSGDALAEHVAQVVDNPPPEFQRQAFGFADYSTFTEKAESNLTKGLTQAQRSPFVFLVAPFVRVTANLLDASLERVIPPFSKKWRADFAGENGQAARQLALAKASTGAAVWSLTSLFAARNYDCADSNEMCITGSAPADPRRAQAWRQRGLQPHSIIVDGQAYAYDRLDPMGQTLGIAADTVGLLAAADDTDALEIATAMVQAVGNNVVNKSYMSGMAEFFETFTSYDKAQWKRWAQRQASVVVPNLAAQVAREMSPEMKRVTTLSGQLCKKNPFCNGELPLVRDLEGKPVPYEYLGGVGLISPIRTSELKDDAVADELWRLEWSFGKPRQIVRGVELDDYQFDRYQALAGHALKMPSGKMFRTAPVRTGEGFTFKRSAVDLGGKGLWEALDGLMQSEAYLNGTESVDPPGQKVLMLKELVAEYREAAQARLVSEYPELKLKIEEAGVERYTAQGEPAQRARSMTRRDLRKFNVNIQETQRWEVRPE